MVTFTHFVIGSLAYCQILITFFHSELFQIERLIFQNTITKLMFLSFQLADLVLLTQTLYFGNSDI